MTGYANSDTTVEGNEFNIELKSVNHRYLQLSIELPRNLQFLECKVNALLTKFISRGKVSFRLNSQKINQNVNLQLNQTLIDQLLTINDTLTRKSQVAPLSVADILLFPNVLGNERNFNETNEQELLKAITNTLHSFNENRAAEGKRLQQDLLVKTEKIKIIVSNIRKNYPKIVENYIYALTQKLQEQLEDKLDAETLHREITFYIQKIDIDEELTRLQVHIEETEQLFKKGASPMGKRLDFLMQELNRESNTLASKAGDIKLSQNAIELKVLIEQMREQIQNIE